jgi:hypothetical protein
MESFTNNHYEFTEFELDASSNNFDDFIFQDASDMTQFEQFDFDPKFRSIQAVDSQAVSSFGPPIFSKYETSVQSSLKTQTPLQDLTPSTNKFQIQIESQNITVPEKPFYMGPTQFLTTLCLTELISRIDQQLGLFFEASFNFFPDHCRVIYYFYCFFVLICCS